MMTRVAAEHDAINLAQGFPDFPAPDGVKAGAIRGIEENINQYAITWGAKRFRDALAAKYAEWYGMEVNPETEVTVTCGATEAVVAALLAIVDPGEEVVVLEPFYENYGPDTILCAATPRFVRLGSGWRIDLDRLREVFSNRTRAIVVNTTLPGMRDRTITVSSSSKTFAVTGWRIGTIIAHPDVTDSIRKVHDFLTVGAPAPLQEGVAVGLESFPDSYYRELGESYRAKRDVFYTSLLEAGFRCERPEGAYYILADFSDLSDLPDEEFSLWLASEVGVAPVPGSSFFHRPEDGRHLVRFAFCKTEDLLVEAGRRLATIQTRGAQ
jgi:aminotransferase